MPSPEKLGQVLSVARQPKIVRFEPLISSITYAPPTASFTHLTPFFYLSLTIACLSHGGSIGYEN